MANLVIKKKLSLEFLGEEHKDDYLTFSAIPARAYDKFQSKIDKIDDKDIQAVTMFMLEVLKEYFIDGVFGGEKVVKADLDDLTGDLIVECFQTITGQVPNEEGELDIDPKSEKPSSNKSLTAEETPQKSEDSSTGN